MYRHIRDSCRVANGNEELERLKDYVEFRGQKPVNRRPNTPNAVPKKPEVKAPEPVLPTVATSATTATTSHVTNNTTINNTPTTIINNTTINNAPTTIINNTINNTIINAPTIVNINIHSFDGENCIRILPEALRAAFEENPMLAQYCDMDSRGRINMSTASPYVSEALIEVIRQVHRDPTARNVTLNPSRPDQALVWVPSSPDNSDEPTRWEPRPIVVMTRKIYDRTARGIRDILSPERVSERVDIPTRIQDAAGSIPTLYEQDKGTFLQKGQAPLVAHLKKMQASTAVR